MSRLTTDTIIDILVHTEMARATSENVPGMKKFLESFIKNQPPEHREIAVKYLVARDKAIDDFLESAKAGGWGEAEPKRKGKA